MLAIYADYIGARSLDNERYDALGVKWIVSTKTTGTADQFFGSRGQGTIYQRSNPLPVFTILTDSQERNPAPIDSIDWGTNSVNLELSTHLAGKLIFSQPSYPGWTVSVDGSRRDISEYEIFQSVQLRPGDRNIRFEYSPWWFPLFGSISLSVPVFTIGLFLIAFFKQNR
jgi:hypothetical protein